LILEWLGQGPVLLVVIAVVFLPGAPLFGVLATAAAGVVLSALGLPWSPLAWVVIVLVIIVIVWLLGRFVGHRLPTRSRNGSRWLLSAALIISSLSTGWRLGAYVGSPAAISQTNDAVFHMNAVRFILENGDASVMHISEVIGGRGFYPAAWHDLVSLVVQVTGADIPVAANMLTLVIGAVIWPLGIAWFMVMVSGSSTVAAYAAILAGVMQNFPLLMFQWGVLFPNALSTALIPAAIALIVSLPVWNSDSRPWRGVVRGILVVALAAGSLAVSQPASLLPWGVACVVWLTFRLLRTAERRRRWESWVALAIVWGALGVTWLTLSASTSGSHWTFFRSRTEAVLDVVLNAPVRMQPQVLVSVMMLVGLVVAAMIPRHRWLVILWGGISGMYWIAAAVGNERFRDLTLGAWYADPYRIAALMPIVVLPLAALGADAVVRTLVRGRPERGREVAIAVAAVIAVFAVLIILFRPSPLPSIASGKYEQASRYIESDTSFLSTDERTLLDELDGLVEPEARVLGNPGTGVAFGYFVSGVDVYPRTWSPPNTSEWETLAQGLRDANDDSAVCDALAAYGDPGYVLDFGLGESSAGRYVMPGMTDFAGQDGFELVAEEGRASLWRITACTNRNDR
jgi:hypothetical protein